MPVNLDMLNRLAAAAPVVNEQAVKQTQAGQALQVQRAVAAAPAGVSAARASQSLAPTATAAAGQAATQGQAQASQQVAQLGQAATAAAGTAQKTRQTQEALGQSESLGNAQAAQTLSLSRNEIQSNKRITRAEQESAARVSKLGIDQDNRLIDMSIRQRQELDSIGRDVKAKILDSRLQFEKDEAGRKFSNDRQLADYALANAQNEQDFALKMQDIKQASDRKVALMEHTSKQLMQAINRGWLTTEQKLDYDQKKYLLNLKRQMDEKVAKERAKARNRQMVAQGVGMLAGVGIAYATGGVGGPAASTVLMAAGVGGGVGTLGYGAAANNGLIQ